MAGSDCRRDRCKQSLRPHPGMVRTFYHESYARGDWGARFYVLLPSSFDSMWLILLAIVTRAHSNCASRSASSASLAAWAAGGFRLEGGAFRRGFLLGFGISTGGGCTFFFRRKGSLRFGGGGGFEIDRGSPINRA